MKKLLALLMGLALASVSYADANEEVLKKLQEMQEQIRKQQEEIADLRQELDEAASKEDVNRQIQDEVNRAIDTTSWSQTKDVAAVTLQKHIKDLKVKGDLRLRYERQERDRHRDSLDPGHPDYDPDYDDETRDRFRTRFRLGAEFKTDEGWDIAFGFATGGSDGTSTNDTWSDNAAFETGDIRLDYAYAKHKLVSEEDLSLTMVLGQQKNPFKTSGLFWDGDLRPTGATLTLDASGAFLSTGAYVVHHNGRDEAGASLYAAQLGYSGEIAEGHELTVASAYYHYNNPTSDNAGAGDPDFDFHIADLYGTYDMKVGKVGIGFEAHVWKNLGAEGEKGDPFDPTSSGDSHVNSDDQRNVDPDDADLGYMVGVSAKFDRFSVGYMYGHVEADSVYGALKDSDFGDTAGMTNTDVEGHKLSLGYKVTKNMSIGMTYMNLNEIDAHDRDGELYQLDFKYKF